MSFVYHVSRIVRDANGDDYWCGNESGKKKRRLKVLPEIMIPLVGTKAELDFLEKIVREQADALIAKAGVKIIHGWNHD